MVDALAEAAPELADAVLDHLPAARDVVNRRLLGAAHREHLVADPSDVDWAGETAFLPLADGGVLVTAARRYAYDRIEMAEKASFDPALLLERLAGPGAATRAVGAELTDACVNLALAYARRELFPAVRADAPDSLALYDGADADGFGQFLERYATEGHNLHPCGRTRLGWSPADMLAHDLESPVTDVGFVAVRRDVHIGDDVMVDSTVDSRRYAVSPVHAWQLELLRGRYPDAFADRVLVVLEPIVTATPTAALRTLLLPPGGATRYLKLSLDIQVTSTRRSVSVASTRNGPLLSALLTDLIADDRVLLLAETAGSAASLKGGDRDVSAITRAGLAGRLERDEIPVPGSALTAISPVPGPTGRARSVLVELVDRFAMTRGLTGAGAAVAFTDEYARLLLPALLALATGHGIALEAHLQNCIPTFVEGVPHRLGLRDFAGLRVHSGRLDRAVALWPGSVVATASVDVLRAKLAYTALQAHLGEIIVHLSQAYGLDEDMAWRRVRAIVDEVYDGLLRHPAIAGLAEADHTFLTAPTLPHKALLTMRLQAVSGRPGDVYRPVRNPLR
jgi:siderophore synthetase component